MNRKLAKWIGAAAALVGITIGCSSVFQPSSDDTSGDVGDTDGFAVIDSEFSDAPVSPGGTGGSVDAINDGVDAEAEETRSFFTAFQIDPVSEDTAGPKFVIAADIDQDGLLDLVTGWNQSQPVQLHLQRRDAAGDISFRTISIAGTSPIAVIAGIEVGQINGDGWLDIVVLSKATGFVGLCPTNPPTVITELEGEVIVLFSPGDAARITDGDEWRQVTLINPYVQDRWIHNQFPGDQTEELNIVQNKPEIGGFTSLAVGDIDGNPGDEIVVALNPAECEELGQLPPVNTVDLWINPGGAAAETSANWGVPSDVNLSRGVPISIMASAGPKVKDIELLDVDDDGDLDLVSAWSNAISANVRWIRNPLIPAPGQAGGFAAVTSGATPGIDICAGGLNDEQPCANGDADCVGAPDGTCVGGACVGGAAPGSTCMADDECVGVEDGTCIVGTWRYLAGGWDPRPVGTRDPDSGTPDHRPIGQVDTGADVITLGDIDRDGFVDVMVRSSGGQVVQWFRHPNPTTLEPEFPPNDEVPDRTNFPWPVFTLTEFDGQEPEGIALGDITGDGQLEAIIAAEGAAFWYDATAGKSVFDPWVPNTIIQDGPTETTAPGTAAAPPGSGAGVSQTDVSTSINTLLVVDLDGDGRNDIVGTLDRRSGAGISDDRLVWYRNIRTEETP